MTPFTNSKYKPWTLLLGKKKYVTVSWKIGEVELALQTPESDIVRVKLDTIQADAVASAIFRAVSQENDANDA